MNQGDIVLINFPYTDLENNKIRPALIISGNNFNKHYEPYFCPITSKRPEQGSVINDNLKEGILDKESFVKTSNIATISPTRIIKKIASIEKEKMLELIEQIKKNFE